jgi:hypothetical protein
MAIIKTLLIILIVGLIGGTIMYFYVQWKNAQKPEVERKWTDPKFRS